MTDLRYLEGPVGHHLQRQAEPVIARIVTAFGELDSKTQAAFLNALAKSLREGCPSELRAQKQLSFLADDLDNNGVWLVEELVEFLKLKAADG